MEASYTIILSLISGGLAGALLTMFFNTRARFWTRYFELQKIVFENPFLYPIWDQAGKFNTNSGSHQWGDSYTEWETVGHYMNSLNSDERYKVLAFIESWGDFVIESHNVFYYGFLGKTESGFTDRAKEIAVSYDLFPASEKFRKRLLKSKKKNQISKKE